jgi:hypothetical protein
VRAVGAGVRGNVECRPIQRRSAERRRRADTAIDGIERRARSPRNRKAVRACRTQGGGESTRKGRCCRV